MPVGDSLRDQFRGLLDVLQVRILKTLEQFEPFVKVSPY
jgi:hypothetical protein